RAERFRLFVKPELAPIAEVDGAPAGFAVTLPDANEALAPLGGRLWPFGWLRLLRRIPRLRSARFILLGVRPEHRARGLGAFLGLWAASAALVLAVPYWPVRLVGYVATGAALHAFGILMHEAVHGNFFRQCSGDRWAAFLLGLPVLVSGAAYRVTHLLHHRYT